MKITKIKIGRFAGIRDYEASFGDQLNVIYGPNEIGKSTLMKAIKFVLFIEPSINPSDLKRDFGFALEDFMPKSGGDRIDIELEFNANGVTYKVRKSFGSKADIKSSELHFGIVQLNDHKGVQLELNKILGILGGAPRMNLKAWMDVIFANQASLSNTFDRINSKESNGIIKNSLASLVSQLEGVSIEEFKGRLASHLKLLTQHWNLTDQEGNILNRPQMSGAQGDFDNPHKKEIGAILKAYYTWRNEQKALSDRQVLENKYDLIVRDIQAQKAIIDEGKLFIDVNHSFFQSLGQRNLLNANLENESNNLTRLNNRYESWVVLETSIANYPAEEQILSLEVADLRAERLVAFQIQQGEQIRGTVTQLTSINELILQKDQDLNVLVEVLSDDLNEATLFSEKIRALQIQLEAQKLKVKLVAKLAFSGVNQLGIFEPVLFGLSVGEEITLEALTQYSFETDEFKLEVSAGEEEVTVLNLRFSKASNGLNQLLLKYGVSSFEALVELNRSYNLILNERNALQIQFNNLLAGRDFDTLRAQVAQGNAIQVRAIEVLDPIIAQRTFDHNRLLENHQRNIVQIQNLIGDYVDKQSLLLEIAGSNTAIIGYQNQLAAMPLRPVMFASDNDFTFHYNELQHLVNDATLEMNQLLQARAAIWPVYESGTPLDELMQSVDLLHIRYERLLAEGHALLKIQQKVIEVETALGANPFGDLKNKLATYLNRLSNGRYAAVEMKDVTPNRIQKDGIAFDNHLLSQGTFDILALATRLAMADYYLGEEDGFFMLDDPMTELDDERKVFASQLLTEIAEQKQIFVFTCHGSHRDLYEGNLVEFA